MHIMKKLIYSGFLALTIMMIGLVTTFAQEETGTFRFVHAVPGVSGVDVYTDGQLTVNNLTFGEATGYINVGAGAHEISVSATGLSTVLWQQEVTAGATPLTLVASSAQNPTFSAFEDDFSSVAVGTSRFSVIHAIEGAPGVTVTANGEDGPTVEYGQFAGTFDLPAGLYAIGVNAGDTVIIPEGPVGFDTNTSQMLIVYGTATNPELMSLSAAMVGAGDSGFVRITHAVPGAPDVDVYADDTLIVPALTFAESTVHLALPAGTYSAELRAAGTDNVLLTADLTVETGVAVTVAAVGTPEEVEVSVFVDDISGVTAEMATLNVINTIPGDSEVTVSLDSGETIVEGLAFGNTSGAVAIEPNNQPISVTFMIDGQSATLELDAQTLYGGVYYDVIAVSASMFTPPTLIFEPTGIAQGIASAPGAGDMMMVEATTEDTTDTETSTETTADTTTETVQVEPTVAPLPTVPATILEEPLPTARILLDPGVNLQLRQYPSTDALSLGLAPSGSTITVNGREGAPIDNITGEEIIAEGEEAFVDPATLLVDEDEDLLAEETWVNFTYPTPDGGTITAWTLALYLDIRTPDGEPQRLADLELIPGNLPGEATATDVTPPSAQVDRVTIEIIGLDSGVNLNVRRTPETTGEVLARVPNGTIADFVGVSEDGAWMLISLSPAEGGTITGWISTNYAQLQLNGENTTIEDLEIFNLYPTADITTIGTISEGAPPLVQPTVDPLRDVYVATVQIDASANLNLRRDPDDQAEVVARIPSESRIVVDGRTEDAEWLLTSFEGQPGWISSAFVTLTFNEVFVEVQEIPVVTVETEAESAG
ncbi:MAG: DUF4397 domain-containing protein [Aggregatilineales bacterium]